MTGFYHAFMIAWYHLKFEEPLLLDIYYITSRNGERGIDIIDPVVFSFYINITQYQAVALSLHIKDVWTNNQLFITIFFQFLALFFSTWYWFCKTIL